MKTYIAPNIAAANKFVRSYSNLRLPASGAALEITSEITGYKIELDESTQTYDSFIQKNGAPVWIPYSQKRKLQRTEDLQHELAVGNLVGTASI